MLNASHRIVIPKPNKILRFRVHVARAEYTESRDEPFCIVSIYCDYQRFVSAANGMAVVGCFTSIFQCLAIGARFVCNSIVKWNDVTELVSGAFNASRAVRIKWLTVQSRLFCHFGRRQFAAITRIQRGLTTWLLFCTPNAWPQLDCPWIAANKNIPIPCVSTTTNVE